MEILIKWIVVIVLQGIVAIIWYKLGYAKREDEFQTKNITFVNGVENAFAVEKGGVKLKIVIYNKKLVDIIE